MQNIKQPKRIYAAITIAGVCMTVTLLSAFWLQRKQRLKKAKNVENLSSGHRSSLESLPKKDLEDGRKGDSILSEEQINIFLERGVIVVPNILTPTEVAEARRGLHQTLKERAGLDLKNLEETAAGIKSLSSTGGSGGVLDLFYQPWKLKVVEHPRLFKAISTLWKRTYASGIQPNFEHPFGKFDPNKGYIYIDRVGFRVPDNISSKGSKKRGRLQRSLTPHLDCCPDRLFESDKAVPKWRPIQAFVALTDTLEPNEGGFECVPGFHLEFDSWRKNRPNPPKNEGDFSPLRSKEDAEVISRVCHIPIPAGAAVFWDVRLPHANSYQNTSKIAREVIYSGFLPDVSQNQVYVQHQLSKFWKREVPTDQWHNSKVDEHEEPIYEFSLLGKKLMMIDPWQ